jgi:protein involved in polysaccharide export with SLBB domain
MSAQATAELEQSLQQQRIQILTALRNRPASGRLVVNISGDISKWENTPADIQLRAGDTLVIPKRPNFVSVAGQVYNPIAISYVPGKDYSWYLRAGGGVTEFGSKKDIYVLRADGSVVPIKHSWLSGSSTSIRIRPGDTVFVPEKIFGGSPIFQNILGIAQIITAAATPLALSGAL